MSVDTKMTKRAREIALRDGVVAHDTEARHLLESLADEVDRLRSELKIADKDYDCSSLREDVDRLREEIRDREFMVVTKWKPLLAAVTARFGNTITPNDFNATQEERTLAACIAACGEKP